MADNKVAVLLEHLSSQFRTFGEGLEIVQHQISEVNQKVDRLENKVDGLERKVGGLEIKVDGLERKVDGIERKVDGLIEDMDMVKPSLIKINNRLDTIEGEIIKINPDARAVFFRQAK